jgi:epoxide hydrolase-like predicted phosphatase
MKKEVVIKAIIFDVGGVLCLGNKTFFKSGEESVREKGVHQYVARKLKISVDQYFDSLSSIHAASIEGRVNKKTVLYTLSKYFKQPEYKIEDLYTKAYDKYFHHNIQLYNFAKKLKNSGYRIGILSDQWHLSERIMIPNNLMRIFKPVIISTNVGIRKPNKKIYQLLIKKLRLKPNEIIFIDNQQWNISEADRLGINTILYKNNKQLFKQLNEFGVCL